MISMVAASTCTFSAPAVASTFSRSAIPMMQEAVAEVEEPKPLTPVEYAKTLPGITDPLGYLEQDDITLGKVRFYREVELKHARVAMLAALGFPLAEQFHPLFATDDAPSFSAFQ